MVQKDTSWCAGLPWCLCQTSSLALNVNKSTLQLMILMIRHGYAEAPAGSPAFLKKIKKNKKGKKSCLS